MAISLPNNLSKNRAVVEMLSVVTSPSFCEEPWDAITLSTGMFKGKYGTMHIHRTALNDQDVFDVKFHGCKQQKCQHNICSRNCKNIHQTSYENKIKKWLSGKMNPAVKRKELGERGFATPEPTVMRASANEKNERESKRNVGKPSCVLYVYSCGKKRKVSFHLQPEMEKFLCRTMDRIEGYVGIQTSNTRTTEDVDTQSIEEEANVNRTVLQRNSNDRDFSTDSFREPSKKMTATSTTSIKNKGTSCNSLICQEPLIEPNTKYSGTQTHKSSVASRAHITDEAIGCKCQKIVDCLCSKKNTTLYSDNQQHSNRFGTSHNNELLDNGESSDSSDESEYWTPAKNTGASGLNNSLDDSSSDSTAGRNNNTRDVTLQANSLTSTIVCYPKTCNCPSSGKEKRKSNNSSESLRIDSNLYRQLKKDRNSIINLPSKLKERQSYVNNYMLQSPNGFTKHMNEEERYSRKSPRKRVTRDGRKAKPLRTFANSDPGIAPRCFKEKKCPTKSSHFGSCNCKIKPLSKNSLYDNHHKRSCWFPQNDFQETERGNTVSSNDTQDEYVVQYVHGCDKCLDELYNQEYIRNTTERKNANFPFLQDFYKKTVATSDVEDKPYSNNFPRAAILNSSTNSFAQEESWSCKDRAVHHMVRTCARHSTNTEPYLQMPTVSDQEDKRHEPGSCAKDRLGARTAERAIQTDERRNSNNKENHMITSPQSCFPPLLFYAKNLREPSVIYQNCTPHESSESLKTLRTNRNVFSGNAECHTESPFMTNKDISRNTKTMGPNTSFSNRNENKSTLMPSVQNKSKVYFTDINHLSSCNNLKLLKGNKLILSGDSCQEQNMPDKSANLNMQGMFGEYDGLRQSFNGLGNTSTCAYRRNNSYLHCVKGGKWGTSSSFCRNTYQLKP